MNFISGFLKGLVIGAGAVAPGVSGGALAVIFGLYGKITNFIAHITKDFKKNLVFFFPIGIGGIVGVLAFSRLIENLFLFHEVEVRYAFVGLMLGTIPSVIKQANKHGYKQKYLVPFIISLSITVILTFAGKNGVSALKEVQTSPLYLIIYGGIIGFGTIIPGISASVILMYLGAYELVIRAISNIQITIIFYLGIGFVLSVLLFAKLISSLFDKAYGFIYYAIIGLVLGSIVSIFPGFHLTNVYLLNCAILISCFILSYGLSRFAVDK